MALAPFSFFSGSCLLAALVNLIYPQLLLAPFASSSRSSALNFRNGLEFRCIHTAWASLDADLDWSGRYWTGLRHLFEIRGCRVGPGLSVCCAVKAMQASVSCAIVSRYWLD